MDRDLVKWAVPTLHEQMKSDPFMFFRGTFHRWAQLWPEGCADLRDAPQVLAVGDPHVGSLGTWWDAEGRLSFGVDDFDESYPLPYTNDLVRLAATVKMVIGSEALTIGLRDSCDAILEGYERTLKAGGCPIALAERERNLKKLGIAAIKPPRNFWEKLEFRPAANGLPGMPNRRWRKRCPHVRNRIEAVRKYRKDSKSKPTQKLAETPTFYHINVIPKEPFMVIPEVSSETREYIPIIWLTPPIIPSNKLRLLTGATLPQFAILTSRMHMAWVKYVGGRLESQYQYSVGICYNPFPWPPLEPVADGRITDLARAVLAARDGHAGSTLADLYDAAVMPAKLMIRRFVLWWHTCRDKSKPSGRAWARKLGITHVWLLKLVRKFEEDPGEVRRLQAYGDPTLEQLRRAKKYTQRLRDRGELRSPRRRVPPVPPAMEQFVRERFAQGWSRSRLARELFLDRKMVKRILQN
jgi:hypothetical protein